jgi:hypothetical protein
MRKFLVTAFAVALSVPGLAPARSQAILGPTPKKVDAWAWCGVHPDDPSAQATANSMATVAGIDATFGPCYLPPPGYTPEDPGVEGQDTPYRYVSPETYRRLLLINAQAGMKTVVYDNRVWDPNPTVRNAAVAFWTPYLANIAAWDLGDEFDPNNPLDPNQWNILIERWNRVRGDVSVRTGIQPFTNHLESALDLALKDLPGANQLLSFTHYPPDLGVSTAKRLDSKVQTLMCGVNTFKHLIFNPTPEKILDDMAQLVAAGCDRFLVFGGFVVYDNGATRGGAGQAAYGNQSIVDTSGAPTTWAVAVFEGQGDSTYKPAGPARLLETRPGLATIDAQSNGLGVRPDGTTTELQVAGRGGVPASATSAVLNITATNEAGAGFLTAYPCGTARPNAAQVNYLPSIDVANAVFVKLDATGKVCIFNSVQTDLVVDINGYNPTGASYVPLSPARVLETRGGYSTIDGQYNGVGFRGGGSVTELQVTGRGGVPAGASEAVLNVTATEVRADGFVTVFPCNGSPPTASNLNYTAGSTVTNSVVAALRDDGRVCFFTSQDIDLVVDVNGFYPKAATFVSVVPTRFLDTRIAPPLPVEGAELFPGFRDSNPPLILQVAGRNGVPSTAKAAVLNVTVTEPSHAGFVTVYPCGTTRPLASNINFNAGATVANLVVAQIGNAGAVCIFKSVGTHIIVDVNNFHP